MAPVKYFGKPTFQQGKYIWDILGNLKNFGVGRVLIRNTELMKYPEEMSFYRVAQVRPAMDEKYVKGFVSCERVYRGRKMNSGFPIEVSPMIREWQLIPRALEQKYLEFQPAEPEPRIVPASLDPPPLMKELLARDVKGTGAGVSNVPFVYLPTPEDGPVRVAQAGENPDLDLADAPPRSLPTANVLYGNLDEFEAAISSSAVDEKLIEEMFGRKRFRDLLEGVKGEVLVEDDVSA